MGFFDMPPTDRVMREFADSYRGLADSYRSTQLVYADDRCECPSCGVRVGLIYNGGHCPCGRGEYMLRRDADRFRRARGIPNPRPSLRQRLRGSSTQERTPRNPCEACGEHISSYPCAWCGHDPRTAHQNTSGDGRG